MSFFTFFKKISKTGYLVALVSFITRIGFFMSLPFLAVYLARDGIFTPSQIGMIIGVSGLIFSITGLFNGLYIDRHSQKNTLIVSLILSGFCYFGFAISMKLFFALLFVNATLGWLRSFADISANAIMVANTKKELLSYAYSAKFMAVNLVLVFGPLFGATMANKHSLLIFYIAGVIHITVGVALIFINKKHLLQQTDIHPINLLQNFKELWKDKILINATFINFILWIVYSQLDSTIPQYLTTTMPNPATLVSKILILNAIICVLFQPIIMRLAEIITFKISGIIGGLLFSMPFILIGFFPTPAAFIIAGGLLSLGELFTMPINGLLIMRSAPKHLVSSYNGLANLSLLGLSIGPILGGYGLQYIGSKYLFLVISLLPIIVIWRYLKSS